MTKEVKKRAGLLLRVEDGANRTVDETETFGRRRFSSNNQERHLVRRQNSEKTATI
jgi:hypothetical protein